MSGRAAVVVGTNYSYNPSNVLKFAEVDAKDIEAVLITGGYNVVTLLGENATRDNIIQAITQQRRMAGPNGLLLVYFAGHGTIDPDDEQTAYLIPTGVQPDSLAAKAIPLDDLPRRYLRGVASAVLLLDCCHSGYALGVRSGQRDERREFLNQAESAFNEDIDGVVKSNGCMILAACSGGQNAHEADKLGHGVFTHHILRQWNFRLEEDLTISALHESVFKEMEAYGNLPLPVLGGIQKRPIVLRQSIVPNVSISTNNYSRYDLSSREKLHDYISNFDDSSWNYLISHLGIDPTTLQGTNRSANVRYLIDSMERWPDLLQSAVRELTERYSQERSVRQLERREAERQARTKKKRIANLMVLLRLAKSQSDYETVIYLAERIRALDLGNQYINSMLISVYKVQGNKHYREGRYADAVAVLSQAIELLPRPATGRNYYYLRGLAYKALDNKESAEHDLRHAAELGHVEARRELELL